MSRRVGISVALAIALGIVAGNLWLEPRAERQEPAEVGTQSAQSDQPVLPSQASQVPPTAVIREMATVAVAPVSTAGTIVTEPVPPPAAPPAQPPVITELRPDADLMRQRQ